MAKQAPVRGRQVDGAPFGVFVGEALSQHSEQPGDKHRRPGCLLLQLLQ
jgi:hypothetical protein